MSRQHHSARIGMVVAGALLSAVTSIAIAHAAAARGHKRSTPRGKACTSKSRRPGARTSTSTNCATCHIHDLTGDSIKDVPPLAGDDFLGEWNGKSVQELLEYMSTNMPADSRGSLAASTYADIAAYVLKTNGFPTGKEALGSDAARLARTFIERKK